ncbi:aldehyde dehydrogenase [Mycobacteroides stephanolepidis]|uniref:Aldehyde dehydrogenase n=1 Tax=[Mycobacterium] stephanolepidis TaxID=1520670 RepID=A0A1Z4ETD6_9MYCO|nr:aldehyde dehydrogenase [[Mycobacterium] stephanolepidis]BAX96204.1 aldehyde dehydrogenase [[Mycobacterium] stephanolepidis]
MPESVTTAVIEHDSLFIGGAWSHRAGERLSVINPSTEEYLGGVPAGTVADVDLAVTAARQVLGSWAALGNSVRAGYLDRLADALEARGSQMAQTVSRQNGMPIAVSNGLEAGFPPLLLRFYAGLVRDQPRVSRRSGLLGGQIDVVRKPMGVVGVIVPWNFPQTLAMMKIAPALAAGNTVVVKPSPETVLDTILLADAVIEAGLPAGVINIVPGGPEIGRYLVSHPGIARIAFTGSTEAGRAIAQECGRLLRPVSLELGGKSATIVLDDGNISASIEELFKATLLNNGQTCFLGTRVLAPRARYGEIVDTLADLARAATIGDALEETTMVGPMVSPRQRERVENYIESGKADGSRLVAGGTRPQRAGWFVAPTVFADVTNAQRIACEEIFGPVLAVIGYDSDEEALHIANDSAFGLGGSVWSADPDRARAFAQRIETGTIGINGYNLDPAAPFGGVKDSGIGREWGPEALESYVELQSIYL